jgi:hypothetical protein
VPVLVLPPHGFNVSRLTVGRGIWEF